MKRILLPPELLARCAETYQPTTVDDFVGNNTNEKGSGARVVAQQLQTMLELANENGQLSQCVLLTGPAGVGKSLLVKFLSHLAGCNQWNTTFKNGTELKMEVLDEIQRALGLSNLFGDWRLLWVDEGDAVPSVAQIRLLSVLDRLPKGVLVVFTSNMNFRNFEDRFQSRFQAFRVNAPDDAEIAGLLNAFAPNDPACWGIAEMCAGNVRQALKDLKGHLESNAQPLLTAAAV